MKAASLREEIVAGCVELAWDQWSRLGVSGAAPARREQRAADPEALLLFTVEIGRNDPRLFDEVLDWLSVNQQLISTQRLRNLCQDDVDAALVDAALAWSSRNPRSTQRAGVETPVQLVPLFWSAPSPGDDIDDVFASRGFARSPLTASGKLLAPRLKDPISFAFRLRRLLRVGVRAEVVRLLLTMRARRISGRVISASAAYAQRNVREGLTHLLEAGVIDVADISEDRHYSIHLTEWAAVLRLPTAADLPFHFDWITTVSLASSDRPLAAAAGARWTIGLHARQPGPDARRAAIKRSAAGRRPPGPVLLARRRLLGRLRRDQPQRPAQRARHRSRTLRPSRTHRGKRSASHARHRANRAQIQWPGTACAGRERGCRRPFVGHAQCCTRRRGRESARPPATACPESLTAPTKAS